jgi:hypothetical protein
VAQLGQAPFNSESLPDWHYSQSGRPPPPTFQYPNGMTYPDAPYAEPWGMDGWRPRGGLGGMYDLGRRMAQTNLEGMIGTLPAGMQRVGLQMARPPSHALGWPYPGFVEQAHQETGIPQNTVSPLLNWVQWGHSDPNTPLSFAQLAQALGGGPPNPALPNDPEGWAR